MLFRPIVANVTSQPMKGGEISTRWYFNQLHRSIFHPLLGLCKIPVRRKHVEKNNSECNITYLPLTLLTCRQNRTSQIQGGSQQTTTDHWVTSCIRRHALNRYAIWIDCNSNALLFLFSWLVSDVKPVYTTEAYIRHWLMRYYLDLVKIIARYEIIMAWYEIIKTSYAKFITLYAILQRNDAIFITRNAIIKF